MLVIHSICFGLEILRTGTTELKRSWVLFPMLLDFANVVLYQGAIFYIQIIYINIDKKKTDFTTVAWIQIELITYYCQIFQAVIYLLYKNNTT